MAARPAQLAKRRRKQRGARRGAQLALAFPPTWGGKRAGAGRKRAPGERARTPHRARPFHDAAHPVHVTLRAGLGPLRSQHLYPTVRLALARAARRDPARFRLVQYSVQRDHVHLVVEARDAQALSAGVRSVAIRIARYVNELLRREGPLWADRWHGRALTSPREVRNALLYVLANFRKHARHAVAAGIDPCSSGGWFDGWQGWRAHAGAAEGRPRAGPPWAGRPPPSFDGMREGADRVTEVVNAPRTWLARAGWRRRGLLGLDEAPRAD